jgi:hypothetical protein
MADTTPNLILPYILAAQAQKHVTHNEAIKLLDAMVQLAVLDRNLTAPPASPVDGDRHIVAAGATGLWAGWDLNIATWIDGSWLRLVPREGWVAWVASEGLFRVWSGTAWVGLASDLSDAIFSLVNDADPTKKAMFSLSGISTGTTRTYTLPNTSSELAILAGTQTFTGSKTFSGTLTASGATATLGTSTGTATYGIGTGATTTGTTKTVNLGTGGASGSTTVVNIGSATAGAGGTTVVNTPTVTFANAVTQVGMPQANLTAQLLGLGGATADSYNRLSMNTPAVLLNNAGAGIEATVNKAAAGNDAAFAFKTGFSARALIGLLGSDDFSFKVSPDGSAWITGLTLDKDDGYMAVQGLKQQGTGVALSSVLFTAGGDGAISIYRNDPSSGSLRTATISTVAANVITLTATEAWKFFDQSRMAGVSMVRIWNTTKAPAKSAWVLARPTTSSLQVQNAADIAGWLATETIQVGDPTGYGMGGNIIALDISPMLIALYGEAFRQAGIECKAAIVGASGDYVALTPSGVTGSFNTAAFHGGGDGTTMVSCSELSPVSNSNLVGIKESIATVATTRLASVVAVYR